MVFGRPHLFAGGFSWNAIVKNLLFCVFSFPVIGPVFYVSFLCLIVCVRVPLRAFSTRDLYGPGRWVFRRSFHFAHRWIIGQIFYVGIKGCKRE